MAIESSVNFPTRIIRGIDPELRRLDIRSRRIRTGTREYAGSVAVEVGGQGNDHRSHLIRVQHRKREKALGAVLSTYSPLSDEPFSNVVTIDLPYNTHAGEVAELVQNKLASWLNEL